MLGGHSGEAGKEVWEAAQRGTVAIALAFPFATRKDVRVAPVRMVASGCVADEKERVVYSCQHPMPEFTEQSLATELGPALVLVGTPTGLGGAVQWCAAAKRLLGEEIKPEVKQRMLAQPMWEPHAALDVEVLQLAEFLEFGHHLVHVPRAKSATCSLPFTCDMAQEQLLVIAKRRPDLLTPWSLVDKFRDQLSSAPISVPGSEGLSVGVARPTPAELAWSQMKAFRCEGRGTLDHSQLWLAGFSSMLGPALQLVPKFRADTLGSAHSPWFDVVQDAPEGFSGGPMLSSKGLIVAMGMVGGPNVFRSGRVW